MHRKNNSIDFELSPELMCQLEETSAKLGRSPEELAKCLLEQELSAHEEVEVFDLAAAPTRNPDA